MSKVEFLYNGFEEVERTPTHIRYEMASPYHRWFVHMKFNLVEPLENNKQWSSTILLFGRHYETVVAESLKELEAKMTSVLKPLHRKLRKAVRDVEQVIVVDDGVN